MPRSWPSPAQLEVDLGEREAVVRVHERLQALLRVLGQLLLRTRDEQAVRLLRAAADAAAQLVELREAEAVGLLDDHDRRVRDVDADLDHRRRHEDVELAALELVHQRAPLGGPQPSVERADAVAAELRAPQALGLLLGCARLDGLRLRDERADDVGLAPVVQVAAEACVGLGAALVRRPSS